jgi:hypothetical protein
LPIRHNRVILHIEGRKSVRIKTTGCNGAFGWSQQKSAIGNVAMRTGNTLLAGGFLLFSDGAFGFDHEGEF